MKTVITLLTSLVMNNINCKTVDQSSTGALLSFPSVIDGPLFNKTYVVSPAQFGYQKYGGKLEAILVLPKNETYHKECPPDSCYDCEWEPLGTNPYIHYIDDWFISNNDIKDYILLIDRLDCYFVDKILHAQEMGASGVIMCDWLDEDLFTLWMPQDWKDNINIPSVLLDNKNCHTLMQHIGVQNWNPRNIDNMKYPSVEIINWTIATIEWGLPHPDGIVEYELWTSSNDYLGSRFKHNFNTTAILLDEAGNTQFTPHMYILNGSHWGCDEMINVTYTLPCKQQCTNNGRYCAVDPEYDLQIGLNGMDVIQENLRSLCVWEYDKEKFPGTDVMWWNYAVLWDENCGVYSNINSSKNFNANCSFAQMDKLTSNHQLSDYVLQKIIDTGGYGYTDGSNTILKSETRLKYNSSIYAVPMIRVNEFLMHGNIDCAPPITTDTCLVLDAICAGFINGTQPDICYSTPSPTDSCTDTEKDCYGICFGNSQLDTCGNCLLAWSDEWNVCIGCNQKVNQTFNCTGICGGQYAINSCGYCKDTRHFDFENFGIDCNGSCSTVLQMDECGNCIEPSSTKWNDCAGCDNVAFSNKKFNECGLCKNEDDTNFDDYGKDCRGICNGMYTLDNCGNCLLPSDETRNQCISNTSEPYPTQNPLRYGATHEPTVNPTFLPTTIPTSIPTNNFPTTSPTKYPTFISTINPTFTPTSIPTFIPNNIPTFIPTRIPTGVPTNIPTFSPTRIPTNIPRYFHFNLIFLCKYNDAEMKFYTIRISLSLYAEIMVNAILTSIQSITSHSINYDDGEIWQHSPWNRAGIINFKMCSIFNNVELNSNSDCLFYNYNRFDNDDSKEYKYKAIGTFGIVVDQSLNKYKKYLSEQFMSEMFKNTFKSNMNNQLNNNRSQRRRNLLNEENIFDVISVKIIDPFNVTTTEYDDDDDDLSISDNKFIITLIICLLVLVIIVIVTSIHYFKKSKNKHKKYENAYEEEGKMNDQIEINQLNINAGVDQNGKGEGSVEGINITQNRNDDELVPIINKTNVDKINKNDDDIVNTINQTVDILNNNIVSAKKIKKNDDDLIYVVDETNINNQHDEMNLQYMKSSPKNENEHGFKE